MGVGGHQSPICTVVVHTTGFCPLGIYRKPLPGYTVSITVSHFPLHFTALPFPATAFSVLFSLYLSSAVVA